MPTAREGFWAARDPATAEPFAWRAAERSGGNPQIYPLFYRAERPGEVRLTGDEGIDAIAATLSEAWRRGHDAAWLRNVPEGGKGVDWLVVKDPAQLRSQFATFDPQKKDSSNLLAGVAGLFGGIGLLSGQKRSDQR